MLQCTYTCTTCSWQCYIKHVVCLEQVKTLKTELLEGEEQFQKLIEYIKQYQQESTDKVYTS